MEGGERGRRGWKANVDFTVQIPCLFCMCLCIVLTPPFPAITAKKKKGIEIIRNRLVTYVHTPWVRSLLQMADFYLIYLFMVVLPWVQIPSGCVNIIKHIFGA